MRNALGKHLRKHSDYNKSMEISKNFSDAYRNRAISSKFRIMKAIMTTSKAIIHSIQIFPEPYSNRGRFMTQDKAL